MIWPTQLCVHTDSSNEFTKYPLFISLHFMIIVKAAQRVRDRKYVIAARHECGTVSRIRCASRYVLTKFPNKNSV
uniref:Uncharacterized protein n=1 Tax=Pararge aegeria TaxID=116150 RepID=S4PT12_9NEOP